MKKLFNIAIFCFVVFSITACKKRDIKGEIITISNTKIAFHSDNGKVVVPTGENYNKTADEIAIPLIVSLQDAAPKRFQVHVETDSAAVNALIADNSLENTILLPEQYFQVPSLLDIPFGVDSFQFDLTIDRTILERNYDKKLAIALDLADPTKKNAIIENKGNIIVVVTPAEIIKPEEIHYIYFTHAGEVMQIPQPGASYMQDANYLTVPVSVSLGGTAGSAFNIWFHPNTDTVQFLVDNGTLENTELLNAGTDYLLPDSIHYDARKNEMAFDMRVRIDALKDNLGNQVALGLTLDSSDSHLLDTTRNSIVIQMEPVNLVEADVTSLADTFIVERENSNENENSPKLVDGNINSKFLLGSFKSVWVELIYSEPIIVNGYVMVSGNDAPDRDPKDWQMLGSNDGINWTVLDLQTNQSFLSRHETKKYYFDNSTPYLYYRLLITKNNGSSLWQQAEWRLLKRP